MDKIQTINEINRLHNEWISKILIREWVLTMKL